MARKSTGSGLTRPDTEEPVHHQATAGRLNKDKDRICGYCIQPKGHAVQSVSAVGKLGPDLTERHALACRRHMIQGGSGQPRKLLTAETETHLAALTAISQQAADQTIPKFTKQQRERRTNDNRSQDRIQSAVD